MNIWCRQKKLISITFAVISSVCYGSDQNCINVKEYIIKGILKKKNREFPPAIGCIASSLEDNNTVYLSPPPSVKFEELGFKKFEIDNSSKTAYININHNILIIDNNGKNIFCRPTRHSVDHPNILSCLENEEISLVEYATYPNRSKIVGPSEIIGQKYFIYESKRKKSKENLNEQDIETGWLMLKEWKKKFPKIRDQLKSFNSFKFNIRDENFIFEHEFLDAKEPANKFSYLFINDEKNYAQHYSIQTLWAVVAPGEWDDILTFNLLKPVSHKQEISEDKDMNEKYINNSISFLDENSLLITFTTETVFKKELLTQVNYNLSRNLIGDLALFDNFPFEYEKPLNFTDVKNMKSEEILNLKEINGLSIEELEKVLRPEQSSSEGFMGKDEKLLNIIYSDRKFIEEKGLTIEDVLEPLKRIRLACECQFITSGAFLFNGKIMFLEIRHFKGSQSSPFNDKAEGYTDYIVHNLTDGTNCFFSDLGLDLANRYGFFEGKETGYRMEPAEIIEVFGIKESKAFNQDK